MSFMRTFFGILLGFVFILTLYTIATYEIPEREFTVISEEFEVRNFYRGYDNGRPILSIEYYDGKQIKILDDKSRLIKITVVESDRTYSYLKLYAVNNQTNLQYSSAYPGFKYRLYLVDEHSAEGISNHRDRKGQDYESSIQLQ